VPTPAGALARRGALRLSGRSPNSTPFTTTRAPGGALSIDDPNPRNGRGFSRTASMAAPSTEKALVV